MAFWCSRFLVCVKTCGPRIEGVPSTGAAGPCRGLFQVFEGCCQSESENVFGVVAHGASSSALEELCTRIVADVR